MTSSGPTSLAKAVKPRRSQKTTLTSVRWLSRRFSCPTFSTSSAICGARKRLRRPMRSARSCERASSPAIVGEEIQFLHVGKMMRGGIIEDGLVVDNGESIGHQEDRIGRVAVHFAERVGEIVRGAYPEQLGDDAELLRFGLRRRDAHRHGEIVLVPQ